MAGSSAEHLRRIQRLTDAAAPDSADADFLIAAATGGLSLAVKAGLDAVFGQHDEVFAALRQRSAALKEAGQYLSANKHEMLGRDKAIAFEAIKHRREQLDRDWAAWKGARERAKAARHQDYLERQEKRERWRENQIAFCDRLENALERLESARNRQRSHLSDLRDKYSSAWSDGYRERVQAWIAEAEDSIADIESKMSDVAHKLADVKSKL